MIAKASRASGLLYIEMLKFDAPLCKFLYEAHNGSLPYVAVEKELVELRVKFHDIHSRYIILVKDALLSVAQVEYRSG